jgi:hypothetical protein
LAELFADNQQLTRSLRSSHEVCEKHNDVATASLIENWIEQTERRTWFFRRDRMRPLGIVFAASKEPAWRETLSRGDLELVAPGHDGRRQSAL